MTTPDDPDQVPGRGPRPLPGAAGFVALGTSVAGCVGVGVWLGIVADSHWHSSPLFLLVGLLLGAGAAIATVVVQVRRYM